MWAWENCYLQDKLKTGEQKKAMRNVHSELEEMNNGTRFKYKND